jgi:hypothetical protein
MDDLLEKIKEEGDFYSWNYKGFDCYIQRNSFKCWCGYVKIPKELPINFDFDSGEYFPVDCHGGVTFQSSEDDFHVIGFDCAHSGDLVPIWNSIIETVNGSGSIGVGGNTYRDKKFVISETSNIVDQLIQLKEVRRELRINDLLGD